MRRERAAVGTRICPSGQRSSRAHSGQRGAREVHTARPCQIRRCDHSTQAERGTIAINSRSTRSGSVSVVKPSRRVSRRVASGPAEDARRWIRGPSRIAGACGGHERRFAAAHRCIRVSSGCEEKLHHLTVPVLARERERCDAVIVRRLRIRAGLQQQPRSFKIIQSRRPVQRCHAVNLPRVYVSVLFKKFLDRDTIGFFGGIGEGRIGGK